MDTDRSCAERMVAAKAKPGLQKCDSCHRELRSSDDWVCSDHRLICNICYHNLVTPDKKIYFVD